MDQSQKNPTVKLSVVSINSMKLHAERIVQFSVSCMKDLVMEDDWDIGLISAYAEAVHINQKFADYLTSLDETRPKTYDEESKREKYILGLQDILMMEALVNVKMSLAEAFPSMTGGRSLEMH